MTLEVVVVVLLSYPALLGGVDDGSVVVLGGDDGEGVVWVFLYVLCPLLLLLILLAVLGIVLVQFVSVFGRILGKYGDPLYIL